MFPIYESQQQSFQHKHSTHFSYLLPRKSSKSVATDKRRLLLCNWSIRDQLCSSWCDSDTVEIILILKLLLLEKAPRPLKLRYKEPNLFSSLFLFLFYKITKIKGEVWYMVGKCKSLKIGFKTVQACCYSLALVIFNMVFFLICRRSRFWSDIILRNHSLGRVSAGAQNKKVSRGHDSWGELGSSSPERERGATPGGVRAALAAGPRLLLGWRSRCF